MLAHVVIQLGRHFETARVEHLAAESVSLTGGWPEPDAAGPLTVLMGAREVQARIVEKGPRRLRLVPFHGSAWSAAARRAWSGYFTASATGNSLP